MSINRQEDVVHVCDGILLSYEKNDVICSNMDGLKDDHAKWSQKEKDNYQMISLIFGI